jgi:hypothetical protein
MNTLHANFNGGLMTPRIGGRFDIEKLRTGCVQLENFIPTPFGGIVKRPGIVIDKWMGNSSRVHAITFKRSATDGNVVFMGNGFGKSDKLLTTKSVAWATATKYLVGDVITSGGSSHYCITNHTSGATFAGDSAYWFTLTNAITGTIWTGGTALTVDFPTPYTATKTFELKYEQTNDVMFFAHPEYMPYRLTFRGDDYGRYVDGALIAGGNWVFEKVPFEFAPYLDLNETRIAVQVQYTGIRKWADSWVTGTAYKAGDIVQRTVSAPVGGIYEANANHTAGATFAGDVANWTLIASGGYAVGDRVLGLTAPYEGQIFTCHTAHGGATADAVDEPGVGSAWESYWNLGTSSVTIAAWAAGTTYSATNKVRYNSVIYECRQSHVASAPINGRYGKSGGNRPSDGQAWTSFWKISSAGNDLSGLAFKLVATEDLFTTDDVGTNWLLELGTTGRYDSLSMSGALGAIGPTEPLFIQGSFLVTTIWTAANSFGGTLYLEESLDGVTWSKVKDWNQTDANDGNISYDGTAPDVGAWYRIGGLKTTARGNGQMKIEAVSAVIKMPFLVESYTSETEVGGKLITVNDQLPPAAAIGVSTTNYRKPAFSPTEGYPRAVCFHDGRIWWAGTPGKGSRIWGSKLDDFYNFLTGSLDDSGLDVTLGATEANDILWVASHNRAMVVGTSGQEWTIDGGDAETVITPTKARARMRTKHGSANISPQVIAESLLFFTRSGAQLREFTYSFQLDGFTAPDMTQLIGGLWSGRGIRCSAYSTYPFPILWVVDVDGDLWSFIYDREQNVTAWAKHTVGTDDRFWSVAVTRLSGTAIEYPVFTLQKEVNGTRHYCSAYMDYLALSWFLTDSTEYMTDPLILRGCIDNLGGIAIADCTVAAGNTTITSGTNIGYLMNRSVRAYDGVAYSAAFTYTGTGTVITGWTPDDDFVIGEVITSTVQSFPLDAMLQDGTGQGRKWRVNRAQLLLHRSQFGQYSDTPTGSFYDIEYASTAIYSGRTNVHIASDWADTTQFTIRHNTPGPFCVLGYVLKGEVSGS